MVKDNNDEDGMNLKGPIINIVLVIIVLVGIGFIVNSAIAGLNNTTITVKHEGLPSEVEVTGVPDNLEVVGIPDNLKVVGIPENINQLHVTGIPENINLKGMENFTKNVNLDVSFRGFENLGRWIENKTMIVENLENGNYSISFQ